MMPIPDYQTIMLPLLKAVSDGATYKISDVREKLSSVFKLNDNERRELLPSGTQSVFDNRVAWAKTYLVKARLLETPKRAHIKISERGILVLQENPREINSTFLKRFDEFNSFIAPNIQSGQAIEKETTSVVEEHQTPFEKLGSSIKLRITSYNVCYTKLLRIPHCL